jgi:large subunit ribosomal protein L31
MKSSIHPKYHHTTVTCVSCGTTFETGSTNPAIRVDICSKCHPFFTGQKRLVDTEGRVERFERRVAQRQETPVKKSKPVAQPTREKADSAAQTQPDSNRPKSLREMLQEAANNTR